MYLEPIEQLPQSILHRVFNETADRARVSSEIAEKYLTGKLGGFNKTVGRNLCLAVKDLGITRIGGKSYVLHS